MLTGLNTDDAVIIRGTLSDFDDAFDQMTNYITIGAGRNIADDMYEVATNIEIGLSERLAAVEDVDRERSPANVAKSIPD